MVDNKPVDLLQLLTIPIEDLHFILSEKELLMQLVDVDDS